jgi:molybdopterin synthase sulfur carrier subunit
VPQAEGDTVGTLLTRLVAIHPALGPELFASDGQLQSHMHVIVNGRDIRFLDGLETQVNSSDQILIFPPVGGGTSAAAQSTEESRFSPPSKPDGDSGGNLTQVTLKFTGHVRRRMGRDRMEFVFCGHTLGALLSALFAHYDLQDLILNEEGEVRPWARVAVNGRFSYLIGDMDTSIHDGDLVTLIYQYAVAF